MSTLAINAAVQCSWCLSKPATTSVVSTPACDDCAVAGRKVRVQTWLRAVKARIQ